MVPLLASHMSFITTTKGTESVPTIPASSTTSTKHLSLAVNHWLLVWRPWPARFSRCTWQHHRYSLGGYTTQTHRRRQLCWTCGPNLHAGWQLHSHAIRCAGPPDVECRAQHAVALHATHARRLHVHAAPGRHTPRALCTRAKSIYTPHLKGPPACLLSTHVPAKASLRAVRTARTTFMPCRTLGAFVTTCSLPLDISTAVKALPRCGEQAHWRTSTVLFPASTVTTRRRSALGCGSTERTSATSRFTCTQPNWDVRA